MQEELPLLQALFADEQSRPQTVSELNADVREAVERRFTNVWVEGEVVDFRRAASGHWYFSLRDLDSQIKCVCWRTTNFRIRFKPENGLSVRLRGRITYWEAKGELKLTVDSIEPVGEGALLVAFEQIKARLAAEGLFDNEIKRPLPRFPRRIGIVTSPDGAALHDILTVLERRARSIHILLIPAAVQGETAGAQIARAIRLANQYCDGCHEHERLDVLIVGRGGGPSEDLWAFNEEVVARAIRASDIPVISAVGHEIDFTIADLAADLRAATPSAAAEIVAQTEGEICSRIDRRYGELLAAMRHKVLSARGELREAAMSPVFAEFPSRVRDLGYRLQQAFARAKLTTDLKRQECDGRLNVMSRRLSPIGLASRASNIRRRLELLEQRAAVAASDLTEGRHRVLERSMARLDAMSPLSVLTRGYSITQKPDGEIIRDAHQTKTGERLNIRLARGRIAADVAETSPE